MKKNTKNIACLFFLFFFLLQGNQVNAQQDSQYTQYMYNTSTINPAYAGSRGVLSLTGIYRTQWVGLEGAPQTSNFTANTPMGNRVGLGLNFVNDQIGPSDESTIAADFSYTIPFGQTTKLAFGLKAGINLLNVDYTKLDIENTTDGLLELNIDNRLTPIFGAGAYLYDDNWYAGISVPNILTTTHYEDSTVSTASERPNIYAIAGYIFNLNENIKFKPAVLFKAIQGSPLALDISGNLLFHDKLTLGAAYRLDAAVSGLAGFQISDGLLIGYAYDYDTTRLGNYNSGSHEIFLRFELGTKRTPRMLSPRFF